jgi:hypothetical protein
MIRKFLRAQRHFLGFCRLVMDRGGFDSICRAF